MYYKDSKREARRHRANEGAMLGMKLSIEQVDAVICKAVSTFLRVLLRLSQIFLGISVHKSIFSMSITNCVMTLKPAK